MKKKTYILDFALSTIILLSSFVCFAMETSRIWAFGLGAFSLFAVLSQLILSIFQIMHASVPWGTILTIIMLTFTQNDEVNSAYIMILTKSVVGVLLLIILFFALVLTSIFFFTRCDPKKVKDFFALLLISGLLSTGVVSYVVFPIINYAFDTSQTENASVTIEAFLGEDNKNPIPFEKHYIYKAVFSKELPLTQISVDADYGLIENGTVIRIKYRQGLFAPIYRIDYSQFERIGN